ncbi:hypothetical protein [Modicisalibacter sp. MOD 31.J]|uniref:hypothetical protein n=1 Tax=Modicisalibacter sp. MOD 31.J TaxID=2831897 RepID=UPI001CCBD5B2|nr:hypothetical protein [Modicisalibacter sp. MOD 31.J]MBZ9574641.1 hypothetical protein [Modicisalibacter sp. MOD 31.J]
MMRLIDELIQHPLLEERNIHQVLEPMGFVVHIQSEETPDEYEEPKKHEAFTRDPSAYMYSLHFEVPDGFIEIGRFDTEDSDIVFLAVKPTTSLARLLLAPACGAGSLGSLVDERQRQMTEEGWSLEHDDRHDEGELACAGAAYALNAGCQMYPHSQQSLERAPDFWMFEDRWWKPASNPRRNLVKAGALVLAEIERLDRAEQEEHS